MPRFIPPRAEKFSGAADDPAAQGSPSVEDVADLLHAVSRQLRRRGQQFLRDDDLTPAQGRALRVVLRAPVPLTMSEIADALGIARRSATSVVDELLSAGLVERKPNPTDRRSVLISATEAGRAAGRRRRAGRQAAAVALLGELSHQEQQLLYGLLHRLLQSEARP